ncbi:MAG: response regulator [Moritella sp.]|uniref:ATP-binding protein n=1 Tax=Moritella sp. TaxID=78556 RepID=UPI001D9EA271|nr:ATP-binding protein [Moritella sp.]NQZ49542.1 response regulator [Moritella sp.]
MFNKFLCILVFYSVFVPDLEAAQEALNVGIPIVSEHDTALHQGAGLVHPSNYSHEYLVRLNQPIVDYWVKKAKSRGETISFTFSAIADLEHGLGTGSLDVISHYDYNQETHFGLFSLPWGSVSWFLNSSKKIESLNAVRVVSRFGVKPSNMHSDITLDSNRAIPVISDFVSGSHGYQKLALKSTVSVLVANGQSDLLNDINQDIIAGQFYNLTSIPSITRYEAYFVDALSDFNVAKKVANAPVMKIAYIEKGSEPYFIKTGFTIGGIAAELIDSEISKMAMKYEYVPLTNFAQYLQSAKDGKTDYISSILKSKERRKYLTFSNAYFFTQIVSLTTRRNADSVKNGIITGKRVALMKGTVESDEVVKKFGNTNEYTYFNDYTSAVESIINSENEVFIGNKLQTIYSIKKNNAYSMNIVDLTLPNLSKPVYNAISKHYPLVDYYIENVGHSNYKEKNIAQIVYKWKSIIHKYDMAKENDRLNTKAVIAVWLLVLMSAMFVISIYMTFKKHKEFTLYKSEKMKAIEKQSEYEDKKNNFLARMSHEIRTPLSAMSGLVEILLEDNVSNLKRDGYEILKRISLSIDKVLLLSNEILDFNKFKNEGVIIKNKPFTISTLLDEICDHFFFQAKNKQVFITPSVVIDNDLIYSDRLRMGQILNNLISNSIKFSSSSEIKVKLLVKEGQLTLAVQDFGIGVSSDKIEMIFEPFIQADTDINRKFGGTGLGLSIVKAIVEAMQGDIWIESELGKGTTVTVTIPVECTGNHDVVQDHDTYKNETLIEGDFSQCNVVVIEDDALNLHVIEQYLKRLGCSFNSFSDARVALDVLESTHENYDLIICDCHMPELDGYGFVAECKRLNFKLPIVALTADLTQENVMRCKEVGFIDILFKPISRCDLAGLLTKYYCNQKHINHASNLEDENKLHLQALLAEYGYEASEQNLSSTKNDIVIENDMLLVINSIADYITELSVAITSRNMSQIESLSHRLKISCLYIGYPETAELFKELNERVNQEDGYLDLAVQGLERLRHDLCHAKTVSIHH